jgi:hypothetical protein
MVDRSRKKVLTKAGLLMEARRREKGWRMREAAGRGEIGARCKERRGDHGCLAYAEHQRFEISLVGDERGTEIRRLTAEIPGFSTT